MSSSSTMGDKSYSLDDLNVAQLLC